MNLLQIGQLKRSPYINLRLGAFAGGANPQNLVFDGTSLWVATNDGHNTGGAVYKISTVDAVTEGSFGGSASFFAVAYDGGFIWSGSGGAGRVYRHNNASDDFYSVPDDPRGLVSDGENIWVALTSGSVSKRRRSDFSEIVGIPVGSKPNGLAFDGTNVWVANSGDNTVTQIQASDGTVVRTVTVGSNPWSIAVAGANVWVTNSGDGTVSEVRINDGTVIGTFPVGNQPHGIVFDGFNLWIANNGSNNVTVLRATDGALQGTYICGMAPEGLAFDGVNVWVANSGDGTLSKF